MRRDDDRGRLQDTIPAGWGVNGALERTTVDQPYMEMYVALCVKLYIQLWIELY